VFASFGPPVAPFPDLDLWPLPQQRAKQDGGRRGADAELGARITRRFFALCEHPRTRARVMASLRSSADSAVAGRLLVALLSRTVFTPLLRARRIDAAAAKFELVAAQLAGVAVLRYVTRMEPVASMSVDELAALLGPAVQAILRPE
jgi:hypothetical protein